MILRIISLHNSVRYIPQSKQTRDRSFKPKTITAGSLPIKQNKKFHKTIKKSLKVWQHKDSEYLKD